MNRYHIDDDDIAILDSLEKDDKTFKYSHEDFHIIPECKSLFDRRLQFSWESCMRNGYFRYRLTDIKEKVLPGNYRLIAKLCEKRATYRRSPQCITDIEMPFDEEVFNFQKVPKEEILLDLDPKHWFPKGYAINPKIDRTVLMINDSPFEYCHSLLVPFINKGLPQVLIPNGLRIAIEMMLLSQDYTLKIGYNSLGAYASVNHLHFHLYYLRHLLYLEDMAVNCLSNECYETIDFPSQGFVFQIVNEEIDLDIESIMRLIDFLLKKRIAHNLFITRGRRCDNVGDSMSSNYNAIRVYVWARKSFFGSKWENKQALIGFNPAVCELGGHLPIRDAKSFESVTEKEVCEVLREACSSVFMQIREEVKKLYEHK